MKINEDDKKLINSLIEKIEGRRVRPEDPTTYRDSEDLLHLMSICTQFKDLNEEDLLFLIEKVRYLGENFRKMNRVPYSVECYNYLIKLHVDYIKLHKVDFASIETDDFAFDSLNAFTVRNLYVYDDCKDLVDLINEVYPDRDYILTVLDEGKRIWFEGLKRDAVEITPEYLAVIDEVEEIVENKLKENPSLDKWTIEKEELKKRGIKWLSPKDLNEGVLFEF